MAKPNAKKTATLTYEDFRANASNQNLSATEKIGFHDRYRAGKDGAIFADLSAKLPALTQKGTRILDIGCGCAGLAHTLIENASPLGQRLTLIDSPEMLAHLPTVAAGEKLPGMYPRDFARFNEERAGTFDVVLVYSVFQYVVQETAAAAFLDGALRLLAPGGRLLLGDLPNVSKRNRFFSSEAGIAFHQRENATTEKPKVSHLAPLAGEIDDTLLFFLMMRARVQGFESYLLEQAPGLPMANRREDLLFVRITGDGK